MSDPAACEESGDAPQAGLAAQPARALALCIEAAQSGGDPPATAALESLEALLPALPPEDIDTLMRHPGYLAVRAELMRSCAETWFERECSLARETLDAASAVSLHELFEEHIPRDAYADELALLRSVAPRRILIIGSGACPMSAIVIQEAFPDAAVVGMDRSARACDLARRLLTASGRTTITIVEGEAGGPLDLEQFDCIVLALTVGSNEHDKERIIRSLRGAAAPHAMLVIRTAAGWGRVLYAGSNMPVIADRANRQGGVSPLQRSVGVAVRVSELPD